MLDRAERGLTASSSHTGSARGIMSPTSIVRALERSRPGCLASAEEKKEEVELVAKGRPLRGSG